MSAERHYGDPTVTYGSRLHDDLGYTPLYVRYNSGRRISRNGQALSALLAQLVAAYPLPVEEIAPVGHSMGGLVARSAAYYGQTAGEPWVSQSLRHVFCLGTPNLGAPLEQSVNLLTHVLGAVDLAGAQVPRAGAQHPQRRGPRTCAMATRWTTSGRVFHRRVRRIAARTRRRSMAWATTSCPPPSPRTRPTRWGCCWATCWCVRVARRAVRWSRRGASHSAPGWAFNGLNHFQLTNHPDVYAVIRQCIEDAPLATTEANLPSVGNGT